MAYKTENQIYKDVKSVIDDFIASNGLTGWACMQSLVPVVRNLRDKTITFNTVWVGREGWQGNEDKLVTTIEGSTNLVHVERYRETREIQINVICYRQGGDTIDTNTGNDITRRLLVYLDGTMGIEEFKLRGYGKQRSEFIRIEHETDDSSKYQIFPGFDLILVYDQTIETPINDATINGEAHGV